MKEQYRCSRTIMRALVPVALFAVVGLVVSCSNMLTDLAALRAAPVSPGGSSGPDNVEFLVFAGTGLPEITLHWAEPHPSVSSYRVHRSESSGDFDLGNPLTVVSSNGPVFSYVDTTAVSTTGYFYVVEAVVGGSVAGTSPEVAAMARSLTSVVDPAFIYVDPSALGGGNGSSENPFNTITDGVTAVDGGGTVLLLDGTYQLSASVTVSKHVAIRSVTGSYQFSEASLNAGDIANTAAIQFLGGSDGSVLLGLRVTGAVRTSSSQGTIRIGSGSGNDPDDVQILWNHLYGNVGVGISNHMGSGESLRTVIAGNRISDHGGGHAVRIDRGLVDGRFEDNIIENVADSGAGINMDRSTGFAISRNHFRNITGHGMNLGGGTNNFAVSDNLLEHTNTAERADGGGIRLYGASHTTSVAITGNTVMHSFNSIYQRDADISGSGIVISGNTIISPAAGSMLIVNAAASGTLNAQGNWFGSANEDDFKDFIDGNVDYSNWLTAAL